jgi:hypothetical protein
MRTPLHDYIGDIDDALRFLPRPADFCFILCFFTVGWRVRPTSAKPFGLWLLGFLFD